MGDETNSTSNEASVGNPVDEIASMLAGEEAAEKDDELESDDSNEDENQSDESTDDDEGEESDENSKDEEGGEEDAGEEDSSDDDSWGSVLGVNEEKLDIDEDGNLVGINVKVDGKSDTKKLDDLIIGYQNNQHNTQKSQALAEEKKEFDGIKLQVVQEYSSKLEQAGQLNDLLETRLVSDFEGVDWEKMRKDDPAEYAAAKSDFSARAQEIQQARSVINQEKKEENDKILLENQGKQATYLQGQRAKMIDNNPTWADAEVKKTEMGVMATFLTENYGFTAQDLRFVQDARLIELVKDAQSFKKGSSVAKKKIKKPVPKFQKKGGSKVKKKLTKLQSLTEKANKLTGANKRHAQVDAVAALLTGEGD